jgi:hypothetical protein
MKKCQIGSHNLNDANNLLAECYGTIGMLSAQRDELLATLKLAEAWLEGWASATHELSIIRVQIAKCEAQS